MKRAAIIKAFLKARRWRMISGLCCLGFAIAITVIGSLPRLPMICLVGVCFLCLLGFWYADLVAFRRRYQWLVTISDSDNHCDWAKLEGPKAEDDIEEMYRSLLQQKENDKKALTQDARQQRKEQTDCYIRWISQMKPPNFGYAAVTAECAVSAEGRHIRRVVPNGTLCGYGSFLSAVI